MISDLTDRFPVRGLALAGLFACAVHIPTQALAEDARTSASRPATFTFQWDNDKVADTDRHYTNGMRLGYTFDDPRGQWLSTGRSLADLVWFESRDALRVGWSLGQDMYTPEDVDAYVPDATDRPYAGWSYAGLSVQNETADHQDSVDLNVGIIGPASKAAQTQNAFHRLINVSVSRGWRHQINNEVGLLVTRTVKKRTNALTLYDGFGGALQGDVIGHGSVQLGNVRTGASLGGTLRIGANLHEDFGPTYGAYALGHKRPKQPTYSFFIGGEARAVAWDAFLDGNAFRESADVKKKSGVLEARTGVTAHWPLAGAWERYLGLRGIRASLTLVHRTREFETQHKADRYGSLSVMVNF